MARRNMSDKASDLVNQYHFSMEKSRTLVNKTKNRNLTEKLQNISNRDISKLEEIKKKVPFKAQKKIQKAIEKQKKKKPPNPGKGMEKGIKA